MPNDLEIRVQCGTCGAQQGEACSGYETPTDGEDAVCPDGEQEAFIPLRLVPENVIESMRAEKLDTAIEAEAQELPSAPDVKPATDEELAAASVGDALSTAANALAPSDALG